MGKTGQGQLGRRAPHRKTHVGKDLEQEHACHARAFSWCRNVGNASQNS